MDGPATIRVFQDAVAIITGGASGIGAALGRELAHRGANVILADRQYDVAAGLADQIWSAGGQASAVSLDVTNHEAVESLVEKVATDWRRLDFIFNNAGIGVAGEAAYYSIDDWRRVIDVDLNGVIYGTHAAYRVMRQQGFGHIVNTASMAGLLPSPNVLSYTTSKHAVVGLSRALRAEAASYGVRVSVLCPGVIRTPIIDGGKYGSTVGPMPTDTMKKLFERLGPMDVDQFAKKALRDIAANRSMIIHPTRWRWIYFLTRLFPSLGDWQARKAIEFVRRESRSLEPAGSSAGSSTHDPTSR